MLDIMGTIIRYHVIVVLTCSHVDKYVMICDNTVTTVVAKDHKAVACTGNQLPISIICKGVGNITTCISDGDRASTVIEVLGLKITDFILAISV